LTSFGKLERVFFDTILSRAPEMRSDEGIAPCAGNGGRGPLPYRHGMTSCVLAGDCLARMRRGVEAGDHKGRPYEKTESRNKEEAPPEERPGAQGFLIP